jgi:FkbM family methyltransferase
MKKVGKTWIPDDENWFDRFLEGNNTFELSHTRYVLQRLRDKEKNIFVDVGGHYGTWTVRLAPHFKKVLSFEPFKKSFECLEKNSSDIPNVEVFNMALGEEHGSVEIGEGVLFRNKKKEDVEFTNFGRLTIIGKGDVPMKPLDDFKLNGVSLIKIDVEGYELHVLRGAEETIKRCKPFIVFEENKRGVVDHNIEAGECGNFLKKLGAKQVHVHGENFYYDFIKK